MICNNTRPFKIMELLVNLTTVATFVRFIFMLQGVELSF